MLKIKYKSNSLERVCTNYSMAQRKYGERMARLIHQRVDELQSADSIEMLVQYSIGRCHPLEGNRKGEYAMDLVHPYRLVFEQNKTDIQEVRIIKIEDYH
ncbi:MAG: type II toxin-antitoxin system RelE/ParE family toxin [Dysgonamonadaceae bacterium]|nr:type II toxin-antitoxin system RelE/ParE family toxin [Dysgonamonadaceae bacterium]